MPHHLPVLVLLAAAVLGQAGVVRQGSTPTDRQLIARFESNEAEHPDRALAAATELTRRHPESAVWAFNAARMHARLGSRDDAIAGLERAAELGHSGVASFEHHTDLDTVRDTDAFRAVLERVHANAEPRRAAFQAAAREHTPPTHAPADLPADAKPPLMIALHGTGGRGREMLDALRLVCDTLGVVCVAPDALRPAGDGFSWTFLDEAEWFIDHLIERAQAEHNTDPDRVILLGFSQGANVALVLARTRPERFAAVIPICGHYEPNLAAITTPPSPTYLLTTTRDPQRRTYSEAKQDLGAHQPRTVLRTAPGTHRLPARAELERALRWAVDQPADRSNRPAPQSPS